MHVERLGRKRLHLSRRRIVVVSGEHLGIFAKTAYAEGSEIARKIIARAQNDEIDAVYASYNEFKSVMAQTLLISKILPISAPKGEQIDYIYEQSPEELMQALLPRYVEVQLFTAILETAAAEHAARMTAMDSASSNAADVIDELTLYMNRVRQASITREIIEVVSGASALE